MQAAKSIGVNKRPLGHSPLRRAAAIAMIVFGVIFFVAGVYGYLANDLRCVNQELFTRVAAARKAALSAGTSVSGGMGLLSEYLKTACIIMILGIALTLLGVMMLALRRERYIDFLCIVPAMIFFMMFVYYPIIDLVRISFKDMKLGNDNFKQVGFKNYKWLFQGSGWKYFFQSLKITITYTFWELVFTLVIGMLLALLFNHMTRYFNVLRAAVFMPKYIAVSTSAIVFLWILHGNHGILNHLLNMLGFEGVDWLNKEDTALAGILFLTFWRVTGYGMMIYLSAMKGIPQDYYEAAAIDGADGVQRFRHITVPLLTPTTVFLLVTTFIASMKVFQSVDVMTGGGPGKATNVMVQWIYNTAFKDFRMERSATVSVVFFIILLVCTALTMKWSNRKTNYDQ